MLGLCKIEVMHILFKKIVSLIFLNNQTTAGCTTIYRLKRKKQKTFLSFQSIPNLDFAEDFYTRKTRPTRRPWFAI